MTTPHRKMGIYLKPEYDTDKHYGSLSYKPGSSQINLSFYGLIPEQEASEVYALDELGDEEQWVYYRVEREANLPVLARYFILDNNLKRQTFIDDIRWCPPVDCDNKNIYQNLIKLNETNIKAQQEKEWQNEFSFNLLDERQALKEHNGIDKFLRSLLFINLRNELQQLKEESESKEAYLQALQAVLRRNTIANNIAPVTSLFWPKYMRTAISAWLTGNNTVFAGDIYDYYVSVILEELNIYGITDCKVANCPSSLRTLKFQSVRNIDYALIYHLHDIYHASNIQTDELSFATLDKITQAFKNDPAYAEEKHTLCAIIKAEVELEEKAPGQELSNQEIEDLTKRIESRFKICLKSLEYARSKKMRLLAQYPHLFYKISLQTFLNRVRDPSFPSGQQITQRQITQVKNQYAVYFGSEIIVNQLSDSTLPLNYQQDFNFLTDEHRSTFQNELNTLIKHIKVLKQDEKDLLKNDDTIRNLVSEAFINGRIDSVKILDLYIYQQLNDVYHSQCKNEPALISKLIEMTPLQFESLFSEASIKHFLALKRLFPKIIEALNGKGLDNKEKFFTQIKNGVLMYELYTNSEESINGLDLEELDTLILSVQTKTLIPSGENIFYKMMKINRPWDTSTEALENFKKEITELMQTRLSNLEQKRIDLYNELALNLSKCSDELIARLILILKSPNFYTSRPLTVQESIAYQQSLEKPIQTLQDTYLERICTQWVSLILNSISESDDSIKLLTNNLINQNKKYFPRNHLNVFLEKCIELRNFLKSCEEYSKTHFFVQSVAKCFINSSLNIDDVGENIFRFLYDYVNVDDFAVEYLKGERKHFPNQIKPPISIENQRILIEMYFTNSFKKPEEISLTHLLQELTLEQWTDYFNQQSRVTSKYEVTHHFNTIHDAFTQIRENNSNNAPELTLIQQLFTAFYIASYIFDNFKYRGSISQHLDLKTIIDTLDDTNMIKYYHQLYNNILCGNENPTPNKQSIIAKLLESYGNSKYVDWIGHIPLLQKAILYLKEHNETLYQKALGKLQEVYHEHCQRLQRAHNSKKGQSVAWPIADHQRFLTQKQVEALECNANNFDETITIKDTHDVLYLVDTRPIEEVFTTLPTNFFYNTSNRNVSSELRAILFNQLRDRSNSAISISNPEDLAKIFHILFFDVHKEKETVNILRKYKDEFLLILNSYEGDDLADLFRQAKLSNENIASIYSCLYLGEAEQGKCTRLLTDPKNKEIASCIIKAEGRNLDGLLDIISLLDGSGNSELYKLLGEKLCHILTIRGCENKLIDILNKADEKHCDFIFNLLGRQFFSSINYHSEHVEPTHNRLYYFNNLVHNIKNPVVKDKILNMIDKNFCMIYRALRAGESQLFKTDFVGMLDEKYPNPSDKMARVTAIILHGCIRFGWNRSSRSNCAWYIMSNYDQQDWVKQIYFNAFSRSPWWATSTCPTTATSFFWPSKVLNQYESLNRPTPSNENWDKKLEAAQTAPDSRLGRILSVFSRG
jgi:hypothetical protein